ncbi:hypothetical protein ACFVVX_34185 [Kitasatospora sp. NPDC058170]|uniref:hypothetical protein n=1 Tax=Kitasatospora sp. NPDC058170 TaxID=3346364 RepID=UPI0036D79BCA
MLRPLSRELLDALPARLVQARVLAGRLGAPDSALAGGAGLVAWFCAAPDRPDSAEALLVDELAEALGRPATVVVDTADIAATADTADGGAGAPTGPERPGARPGRTVVPRAGLPTVEALLACAGRLGPAEAAHAAERGRLPEALALAAAVAALAEAAGGGRLALVFAQERQDDVEAALRCLPDRARRRTTALFLSAPAAALRQLPHPEHTPAESLARAVRRLPSGTPDGESGATRAGGCTALAGAVRYGQRRRDGADLGRIVRDCRSGASCSDCKPTLLRLIAPE